VITAAVVCEVWYTEAAALIALYSESSSSELKQTGVVSTAACSSCKRRSARCATHDLEPSSSDVSACLAYLAIPCMINVVLLCLQTSNVRGLGGRCGTCVAAADTSLAALAFLVVSCRQCAGGVGDGYGSVLASLTAGDRLIVACSCCTIRTRIASASIFCRTHAAGSSAHGFTTCVWLGA
jgi:hypothetical protein